MSVTADDLQDFNRYVVEKLATGDADSLRELAGEWEAAREREDVVTAIREGLDDIKAGRTESFEASQENFRAARGLPPRQ